MDRQRLTFADAQRPPGENRKPPSAVPVAPLSAAADASPSRGRRPIVTYRRTIVRRRADGCKPCPYGHRTRAYTTLPPMYSGTCRPRHDLRPGKMFLLGVHANPAAPRANRAPAAAVPGPLLAPTDESSCLPTAQIWDQSVLANRPLLKSETPVVRPRDRPPSRPCALQPPTVRNSQLFAKSAGGLLPGLAMPITLETRWADANTHAPHSVHASNSSRARRQPIPPSNHAAGYY